MSTQTICDNCEQPINDVVAFRIEDESGVVHDACSAECAVKIVVTEAMFNSDADLAVDNLGSNAVDEEIDSVISVTRKRYDALEATPAYITPIMYAIRAELKEIGLT